MTDQWPLGPYVVLEPTENPFYSNRIPAGSMFEARQIADRLEEQHRKVIGIYKWVADDEGYVLVAHE